MEEDRPKSPLADEKPEGDDLSYGFAHPAHRPDPRATYGFEPAKWRTLPIGEQRRWRVPG